ncbi:MAG: hypothetical protein IPG23_00815 [Burkholderiales bacterium]|nr:hypothetical protein [Burkholderiales bacterium]
MKRSASDKRGAKVDELHLTALEQRRVLDHIGVDSEPPAHIPGARATQITLLNNKPWW